MSLEKKLNHSENLNIGKYKQGLKDLEGDMKDTKKRVNREIDSAFEQFKKDLEKTGRENNQIRRERNLSIEKLEGWKLRLKSYGKTLELDLKSGEISCMKGGKLIVLWTTDKKLLDISNKISTLKCSDLCNVFGQMNLINRAMNVANKVKEPEKRFYFERIDRFFLQSYTNYYLKVGPKNKNDNSQIVISFVGIQKWFGDKVFLGDKVSEEWFLNILNKVVL